MLHVLRRHPFAVEAFFEHSLVLTYAVPTAILAPLVGPGLEIDGYDGWGFLAIAMVKTRDLRPRGLPSWLGRDFFLSGYRVFTRFVRTGKQTLRGLRILRSDTDRAIRDPRARQAFFEELRRSLRPGGRVLIVEHLRDLLNFLSFGPGFLHFESRREWLRLASHAKLTIASETRITPWVMALALERPR